MGRFPFPLFNERVTCRLGEGLEPDNNLQPEKIKIALETLSRFSSILRSIPNLSVRIVATAATRRAKNANDFLVPAQEILNHEIKVLKKEQEARLVSIGLLSNFNIRDGLIVDANVVNSGFGFTDLPDLVINSDTGAGAKLKPVLKFTRIDDASRSADTNIPFDRNLSQDVVVTVISCITK